MPIEPRSILETFFLTGHVTTQDEYWDVLASYIHMSDDNLTIYQKPGDDNKRLGIGTLQPEAPLAITATGDDEDLIAFNHKDETEATWFFDLNPAASGHLGFNIDQVVGSGKESRLFIQESDGNVGLGTTAPSQKLHIQESTGTGVTGFYLLNTATAANDGFIIGHEQSAITEEDGALSIYESTVSEDTKRVTIRAGGRVGINELIPDTHLHIGADVSIAQTDVDVYSGTGIVTIGPITQNIVADYRTIQARSGSYDINGVLSLEAAELNLQRVGGSILIHGDMDIDDSQKIMITDEGRIGLGTLNPLESIHTEGAIILGDSNGAEEGTIRFTGLDFEGFKDGDWYSLTGSAPPPPFTPWVHGPANSIYYLAASNSRVGIGTNSPDYTLDIDDGESGATDNIAATIYNHAQSSDPTVSGVRVNTKMYSNGVWPTGGTDIGLYVSEVSGTSENQSNIAAVLNGNVAIGDLSSSEFLGVGANRVLSIQNGTAPAPPAAGSSAISVQLYSQNLLGTSVPTLHIMRADGSIVKLYQETGLTESDESTITEVYDATTQAVIERLRLRIDQLETRLGRQGLLADPVPAP
ncbi:MAG: hypothetical protein ACJ77K_09475 [Bacteroidia bacterium]